MLVRLDRTVLEGELDWANAEIVAMHFEVYKAHPQIGAIIDVLAAQPGTQAVLLANRVSLA